MNLNMYLGTGCLVIVVDILIKILKVNFYYLVYENNSTSFWIYFTKPLKGLDILNEFENLNKVK